MRSRLLTHVDSSQSSTITLTGSHLERYQSRDHLDKIARGACLQGEEEKRTCCGPSSDLMPSLQQPDITLEREIKLSCQYYSGSVESFPSVAYYHKTTPDLSLPSDPQLTGSGSSQAADMNYQHDYNGASMQPAMSPFNQSAGHNLPSLSALTGGSMQPPPLPPAPSNFQLQQPQQMAGYAPPP